ncbi:hypothetical protein BGZ65_010262 [Modicella reniformis]|uniref:Uncharacterized protein n=1 Tax=Modicella reniformis TaxID=1440133 RepID=A0A9P6SVX7_9FUNG|nr:hypothetical protein BGZ65_010262 [Modicella reniformis]
MAHLRSHKFSALTVAFTFLLLLSSLFISSSAAPIASPATVTGAHKHEWRSPGCIENSEGFGVGAVYSNVCGAIRNAITQIKKSVCTAKVGEMREFKHGRKNSTDCELEESAGRAPKKSLNQEIKKSAGRMITNVNGHSPKNSMDQNRKKGAKHRIKNTILSNRNS